VFQKDTLKDLEHISEGDIPGFEGISEEKTARPKTYFRRIR
jgi:hypothetical protein